MNLPLHVVRCGGVWSPNEKSYVAQHCANCKRFLGRNDPNTTAFPRPPVEDEFLCTFKIDSDLPSGNARSC